MSDFSWNKAIQKMTEDEEEKRILRKQNQPTVEEVKAYPVTVFKCECPYCKEITQLADNKSSQSAAFIHECSHCHNKFSIKY